MNYATRHITGTAIALAASVALVGARSDDVPGTSLDETRIVMGKWIETQRLISKERNDWQQGKEILNARVEVLKKQVATLEDDIKKSSATLAENNATRDELLARSNGLGAIDEQLKGYLKTLEADVRQLFKSVPDLVQKKIQPLFDRMPDEANNKGVTSPERFQNVLGMLNELNKANNDFVVNVEYSDLDGKTTEVRALYIGLAQAYYVSASGQAGIGRPSESGWKWEPTPAIARDVLTALEIIQGKHSPAFVPLPVKLQ